MAALTQLDRAASIVLDATMVRMLLVPALVTLFGRLNCWLPHLPAPVLRVAPSSHVPEEILQAA